MQRPCILMIAAFVLCQCRLAAPALAADFGATGADIASALSRPGSAPVAAAKGEQLKVDFVLSEPCSLIAFMDILSGRNHTSTWVKEWFERQRKSTAVKDAAMIALYKGVMDENANHDKFADDTGRKLDLDQKLMSLALECDSASQLMTKAWVLIPQKQSDDLKASLEYFAPIYHDLVWAPRLNILRSQLEEHRRQARQCKMNEMLGEVRSFMRSPWSSSVPFVVVLTPLPVDGKSKHGESMGRLQLVELRPSDTFEKNADVVFHEACHALWLAKKDLKEADGMFVTASGVRVPLTEVYEGMATALGQGCFAQQAFGKTGRSWYRDRVIDDYSHHVVKLYAEYLNTGRPIDADFGRRAADIFLQMYPNSQRRLELTSELLVLADDVPNFEKFKADVYGKMPRLRGCSICVPSTAPESMKTYGDYESPNVCVLVTPEKVKELTGLGLSSEQLANLAAADHRKPAILAVGKKQIVFCLAPSAEEQQAMLFKVLSRSLWPSP